MNIKRALFSGKTSIPEIRKIRDRFLLKIVTFAVAVFVIAPVSLTTAAQTQQLPIEYYLNILPPNFYQVWWDPLNGNIIYFDAAGKLNSYFHLNLDTTVTGKVTVRYLADGTQQYTVITHTTDGICWGRNGLFQMAFGYRPAELSSQVTASLGRGTTRAVYAPQPIGPINRDWPLETLITTISCDGQLRAGSGYPSGTEGFAQTTQTALFSTGVPSGCPPEGDADCFPAEKIQFKPTGN